MSVVVTLLKKDFLRLRRDRVALLLLFIVPIVLIMLLGQVYGVNRRDTGPVGIALAVVNQSTDPGAARLISALQGEAAFRVDLSVSSADEARALMHSNRFRFALVLPADLMAADRPGLHLMFLSNPRNAIESSTVYGILQRAIYSTAPELLLHAAPAADTSSMMSRLVRIDREQVIGADVKASQATQIVGGWAMMFLLFALSNSSAAIYTEKDQGLYQRLLSAPVSRAQIVWSKFLYGVLLGVFQLVLMFFAGSVLYGIQVAHHLPPLLLVCAMAAATCTALGLAIAAFMPTAEASRGAATLLILLMSAIGGAWWPVSFMPEFIQHLSTFTPIYWSIRGFEQVLWSHDSWLQLLPTLGILASIAAAVMALAGWQLRRSSVFQ
jgi:ABC-2 type transport system permease protein